MIGIKSSGGRLLEAIKRGKKNVINITMYNVTPKSRKAINKVINITMYEAIKERNITMNSGGN